MSDSMNDQEFEKQVLLQTELGQKALEKHEIGKAFDYLLIPSLFNAKARRLFLTIPNTHTRMYLLNKEQIERLKEGADQQYPLHQYTYGRYLQLLQPYADAAEDAGPYFEAAKAEVPDALCALGYLIRDGHYGVVDREKYIALVDQAFQQDSMLANRKICLRYLYGQDGVEANPQFVIDSINKMLDGNQSEDIAMVNPCFYATLGDAYAELKDIENAEKYYMKAIRMGYYEGFFWYCTLHMDYGDDIELQETYLDMLEQGCLHDDPGCYAFRALFHMNRYEEYDEETRKEKHAAIQSDLENAIRLGHDFAPTLLGEAYYYGDYGFEEDNTEAWNCFIEGTHREDAKAFAMVAQMIGEKNQPFEVSKNLQAFCELNALRRGDNDQLASVMDAYQHGMLDFAKDEIDKYYRPKYDQMMKEFHDRLAQDQPSQDPDEPPMKLIAIIEPNGDAVIHEFDVEYWDELPPMIDAGRLDAIRTQPLYDLTDKMAYRNKHITAWVDNMGLLKGLPENRIGCKLYPGSIVGDLILTLEDNRYEPMSFDNLEDLKKILVELGAHLVDIRLSEGPDDDGRFDPWS